MENENESAKVNNTPPPIPGNLSYCIAKKVSTKSRFRHATRYVDTAFADFLWCIKVRSKNTTRPNITGILIEPAKIVATDGQRMHIITNPYPSIPPGEYDVYQVNQSKVILITKAANSATSFPDWNRLIITMEGSIPEHKIAIFHPAYFYTDILKHRPFEIKYLQDAISNEPMGVRIYGENQPIIITTNTRISIVMPLLDKK